MVTKDNSEDGNVEVWSTDSEDEEVRRPTHEDCFMMKDENKRGDKCFMVKIINSES